MREQIEAVMTTRDLDVLIVAHVVVLTAGHRDITIKLEAESPAAQPVLSSKIYAKRGS